MTKTPKTPDRRAEQAYETAGEVVRDQIREERPDDARELDSVTAPEVAVVGGQYDHIERVMRATQVPFTSVAPGALERLEWDRLQVLLVNCPGQLDDDDLGRIAPWVRAGGYLLTTDWALKHVVESLFPSRVRHNGAITADCVVRVEVEQGVDDPLIAGFLEEDRDPLWWLEGSSYPIEVLDPAVRVLIRSREVRERWGADPVAVTFTEGEGTVVHLLSHLYLQRSDVRTTRDAVPAAQYFASSKSYAAQAAKYAATSEGLSASEVVSAITPSKMVANILIEQKRRSRGRK